MPMDLAAILSSPPSGRVTAVVIDHQQYAQTVILRGRPIPWSDAADYSQFIGQAQGLLRPDTTLLDLGAFYAHALATDERLRSSLSARNRRGYALKTLLADGRTANAALELATAVLGCELADAERSARAALARVLDTPVPAGLQTVRLHPRDLEALRTAGVVPGIAGVELVADPHLAPGDAVGEHPDGFLDARIGAALDRARAALADLDEGAAGAPTAGIGTLPHQRGQRA